MARRDSRWCALLACLPFPASIYVLCVSSPAAAPRRPTAVRSLEGGERDEIRGRTLLHLGTALADRCSGWAAPMTATVRDWVPNFIVGVLSSIVATAVYKHWRDYQASTFETALVFVVVFLLVISSFLLRYYVSVAYRSGIVGYADSHRRGKGSPEAILARVRQDLCFMGAAASRWLEEPLNTEFKAMVKRLGPRTGRDAPVRVLILSPDSPFVSYVAASETTAERPLTEKIRHTVEKIAEYRRSKLDIDLRFYADPPLFRLAFVDDEWLYLGYYRPLSSGENSPQLILNNRRVPRSFYRDFKAYFEREWAQGAEPDWERYGGAPVAAPHSSAIGRRGR
jgi:hypothetical protein